MTEHAPSLCSLIAFVHGELSAPEFEHRLYHTPETADLLSSDSAPAYCHSGNTLFEYLIGLDYADPGDVLNAQGALAEYLNKRGVAVETSATAPGDFELILAAQPARLDVDTKYLTTLLAGDRRCPPTPYRRVASELAPTTTEPLCSCRSLLAGDRRCPRTPYGRVASELAPITARYLPTL